MNVTGTDSAPCRFPSATKETAVPAKRRRRVTVKTTPTSQAALLQSAVEVRQTLRDSLVQVNGRTPLHLAAMNNPSVEAMKYLIARGGDVQAKTNQGNTPFDLSETKEKETILRDAGGGRRAPSPPTPRRSPAGFGQGYGPSSF